MQITRRGTFAALGAAGVLLAVQGTASADQPEITDVLDQGEAEVYAADGAQLVRQPDGIAVTVRMPTPEPGSYVYPDGTEPGHPEVYTLWAFVFNHPEHCSDGACGADDAMNPDVEFGAYNLAGHASGGGQLTLSGRVGVGDPAIAPPGVTPHPLSNPAGAVIHAAVAPHGGLDSSTLPEEFRSPRGSPACGCWFVALFE